MLDPNAHVFAVIREFFQQYRYWTIAFMLLVENAGVPAPGEATLLFASVLASYEHQLRLTIIIVVAIAGAVFGDNAGYAVGYFGGRLLVDRYLHLLHISDKAIQKGGRFFIEHGALSIFWARFIDGLRIAAGLLAGALHMPYRRFLMFNFLGPAAWSQRLTRSALSTARTWIARFGSWAAPIWQWPVWGYSWFCEDRPPSSSAHRHA